MCEYVCACVREFALNAVIQMHISTRPQTKREVARAKGALNRVSWLVSALRVIFAYWLAVAPSRGNAVFLYRPIWVENPLLFSIAHTQIIARLWSFVAAVVSIRNNGINPLLKYVPFVWAIGLFAVLENYLKRLRRHNEFDYSTIMARKCFIVC